MLLVRQPKGVDGPQWALRGTFLHQGKRLADAVTRSLTEKAGITCRHPTQLAVVDAPDRDERGWVLSVAHLAAIPYAALEGALLAHPEQVRLAPMSRLEPLPYDHKAIVAAAVRELQRRYADRPDPQHLVGTQFSIRELRDTHEAIAGTTRRRTPFDAPWNPTYRGPAPCPPAPSAAPHNGSAASDRRLDGEQLRRWRTLSPLDACRDR